MRTPWLLVAVVGCGFAPRAATSDAPATDGTTDSHATPDASPDAPIGQTCFGLSSSSLFTQCYANDHLPTNSFTATTRVFDTVTDCTGVASVQTSHAIQACVIAAKTITISGTLTVHGARPLVLLATQTLTIATGAAVDVSSNHTQDGPDSGASACNPLGAGGSSTAGGGGGTGGSFGTAGGSGGTSGASDNGGTAVSSTTAITLRGGCDGAHGGDGNANNHGGVGGHAGGAVYMLAGTTIQISGRVWASGAGGRGGDPTSGGGGGGTGGLIGLDAPSVQINSLTVVRPEVISNGGGGAGGGAGGNNGGSDGSDGTLVSTPGAMGGMPGMNGAMMMGGAGGTGTNLGNTVGVDGGSGAPGSGGGGGGGGYGLIWIVTTTYSNVNGDISPIPLVH